MTVPRTEPAPITLGSLLFTMVEPHRGHEVAYNRWYERDHFYAGCMIGAYQFAGDRFVATRRLKDLRYPVESPMTPDPLAGTLPRDLLDPGRVPRRVEPLGGRPGDRAARQRADVRRARPHPHRAVPPRVVGAARRRRHADRARARPELRRPRRQRRRAAPTGARSPRSRGGPARSGRRPRSRSRGDPT